MAGATPTLRTLALIAAVGPSILLGPASAREIRARPVGLPDAYFEARLAEMWPLLLPAEAAAFDAISGEAERLAFLEAAWAARDPTPGTVRNDVRAEYEERLRRGRERIGAIAATDPADARLRLIALLGVPDELLSPAGDVAAFTPVAGPSSPTAGCPTPPVELFVYHRRGRRDATSVLVKATENGWRLHDGGPWTAGTGNGVVLAELSRRRCREVARGFLEAVEPALERPLGWSDLLERAELPPPDRRWLESVRSGAPALPMSGARPVEGGELVVAFTSRRLEVSVDPRRPWRQRRSTVVDADALLALDLDLDLDLDRGPFRAEPWISLRVRGELFTSAGRGRGMIVRRFERARTMLLPATGPLSVPLSFSSPAGEQLLVLQVDEPAGRFSQVQAYRLEVPLVPGSEDREPAPTATGLLEQLDRMPSLRLRLPDAVLVGERPVQAITQGAVARVEYRLDGELAGAAKEPPFEAILDFGRLPLERGLSALGFDARGRQVAADRLAVNPGLQRLRLDLVELTELPGAVRARARLVLPVEARLERVEWYLDERRVASSSEALTEILPLTTLPGQPPPRYVRARARLRDGRTVEDTRFLDSDAVVDRVEVDLVQLFVRVSDRRGREITDLEPGELVVLESGEPQRLRTIDHAQGLSLQLALLVDVSSSMESQIELVRAAATAFLERILRPQDQGAILAFRNAPGVIAPFGPAPEWWSDTLTRFQAWGGTALWDSIALTAYYAQGLPGKKAVVVVTDGDDRYSELTSTDVEELAQRMGVAVYVIGLGIAPPSRDHVAAATVDRRRPMLTRLATNTGGRYFPALGEQGLTAALETIERDLRSQYVVTFQSEQEGAGFRRLEVEVSRPGARASTMAGYYP